MQVVKGPGGLYWTVQDGEGNVINDATYATKEDAEAAMAKPSAPAAASEEDADVKIANAALVSVANE